MTRSSFSWKGEKKVLFISIEKYHTKQRARHPKKKPSPKKPGEEDEVKLSEVFGFINSKSRRERAKQRQSENL